MSTEDVIEQRIRLCEIALDVIAEKMAAEDRARKAEAREAALREALSEIIYGSSIGTLHKARQVARVALAADPESEEAPE
jgi:hypothetical protein